MSRMPRYPNHRCECEENDLSQAYHPVVSENGLWVHISCGAGHRRSVTRERWDAEVARRRGPAREETTP